MAQGAEGQASIHCTLYRAGGQAILLMGLEPGVDLRGDQRRQTLKARQNPVRVTRTIRTWRMRSSKQSDTYIKVVGQVDLRVCIVDESARRLRFSSNARVNKGQRLSAVSANVSLVPVSSTLRPMEQNECKLQSKSLIDGGCRLGAGPLSECGGFSVMDHPYGASHWIELRTPLPIQIMLLLGLGSKARIECATPTRRTRIRLHGFTKVAGPHGDGEAERWVGTDLLLRLTTPSPPKPQAPSCVNGSQQRPDAVPPPGPMTVAKRASTGPMLQPTEPKKGSLRHW